MLKDILEIATLPAKPEARIAIPANSTLDFYIIYGAAPCWDGCFASPGETCCHGSKAITRGDYHL